MKKFRKLSMSLISFLLIITMVFSLVTPTMAQTVSDNSMKHELPLTATFDEVNVEQGNIIGEDKNLRDEYTKYFITDTGCTLIAQYPVPVHYKNDNGDYVNYDNSLISSQAMNTEATFDEATLDEVEGLYDTFENKDSDSRVSHFKKSGKSKLIEITKDGYTISWGYSGAKVVDAKVQEYESAGELSGDDAYLSVFNLSSKVIYENIYNNIDLEVINSTTGVKENLILKDSNVKNVFKIKYSIGDLIAESVDEQTIELKDAAGKIVYTISAPYMKDGNDEVSDALELKILSNNNGKLSVKLTADKAWLKDKSRVYPVVVDPVFGYRADPEGVDCTFIESKDPYTPNGNEQSVYVGTDVNDHEIRTLVKVNNLENLIQQKRINMGDMIISASVQFYLWSEDLFTTSYVGAYEITDEWFVNDVTWDDFGTGGYDADNLIDYKKFDSTTAAEWISWDITELVKKWYSGSANNGFMLKMVDGTPVNQCIDLCSSNFDDKANLEEGTVRPLFNIAFQNNKGIESYWDYTTIDCGKAGTAYINDYSGNLVFCMPLASTTSITLPAELSYIYNSYFAGQKYTTTSPHTGRGWKMNVQQTLFETTSALLGENQSLYPYVYTDADGTEHYFQKKGDKYCDEDGLNLELFVEDDHYKIIDTDNNYSWIFDDAGRLTTICDESDNEVKINLNGKNIESIEDPEGDIIDFIPNDTTNNYVKTIVDSDGKQTNITFSGAYIDTVSYHDGTSVSFKYDSLKRLISVTDVNGSKVVFGYSDKDSKGVTSVTEYSSSQLAGQKVTFNRDKFNTTVVRTSGIDGIYGTTDDILTEYQYDNLGRATSSNSKTAEGEYLTASNASYTSGTANASGSNIKTLNKLKQSYSLGANRENLIVNHNLESLSNWKKSAWGANDNNTVVFTVEADTNEYLYGKGSLKMNVTSVTGDARGRVYQDVSSSYIEAGELYTLSCYVKTKNIVPVSGATNYGAVVSAALFHTDGTITGNYSSHITLNTDEEINDGYRRISVSFVAPEDLNYVRVNLALRAATGTAYFDGVQLEKSDAASAYNLLENADLERYTSAGKPTSWSSSSNFEISNTKDTKTANAKVEGTYCFRIKGKVDQKKYLYQDVPIDTTETATYILSGWATANAVPKGSNSSTFRLLARVYYTDGDYKDNNFYFNTTLKQGQWQYVSGAFNINDGSTTKTPKTLRIYLVYNHQSNYAYFDNIQLTKEAVSSYTYNDDGKLVTVKDNAEQNSSYKYSGNLLTEYVDPNGNKYNYTYNDNKQVATAKTSAGAVYTYSYDSKGNATSVEGAYSNMPYVAANIAYSNVPAGAKTYTVTASDQNAYESSKVYDAQDGSLLTATDNKGNSISYTYNDKNDVLTGVTNGTQSVSYEYGVGFKNITKLTHGNTVYSFGYDTFGNLTTAKVGNKKLFTNQYGANNGNLEKVTYGNGNYVDYSYDNFGNYATIKHNGVEVAKNYTDSNGNVIRSQDLINDIETHVTYDSTGRLISKDVLNENSVWQRSLAYNFDKDNNITKLSFADKNKTSNTTKYTYKADNLPATVEMQSGKVLTFSHDGLGRITGKAFNTTTPIAFSYTYVESERSTNAKKYTTSQIATEVINGITYSYTYDKNGNILKEYQNNELIYNYGYDNSNQLIYVGNYKDNTFTSYIYENGNISKKTIQQLHPDYGYPIAVLDEVNYSYGDSQWSDLLTAFDGETITYDTIGNPLTYRDGMSMLWQNGKELKRISKDNTTINFQYDPNGVRTKKTVNVVTNGSLNATNVEYVYEENKLIQMKYANSILDFSYDSSGEVISVAYRSSASAIPQYYYYGLNSHGDVIALYNSSGNVAALYEYDAYGKVVSVTNSTGTAISNPSHIAMLNPLRYAGYVYDNETGLYYNITRYYDPTTARFINADSIDVLTTTSTELTDKNLFAYCDNNPITRADDGGEFWHLVAGAVIGGVIGGVSAWLSGGDGVDILIGTLAGAGSGLLTASGAGAVVQVVAGAGIAMASNAAQQTNKIVKKKQEGFDVGSMIFDGVVGGACGVMGGNGASYGNTAGIKAAGKNFTTQVFKNGRNASKAAIYYAKTAHRAGGDFVMKELTKSLGYNTVGNAIITFKERLMQKRYG